MVCEHRYGLDVERREIFNQLFILSIILLDVRVIKIHAPNNFFFLRRRDMNIFFK
jgi:hypothetical protein